MKKINYSLLLSSSKLEKLGIKEINRIKQNASYKEKSKEHYYSYDGKSSVPLITNPIIRENMAKEKLNKDSEKDKSITERLLFSTNLVYFDDEIFEYMLKSGNITKEDIDQISMTIDNVKSLQFQQIDLKNRYKLLTSSFLIKMKQLFNLKQKKQNTETIAKEIDSMKQQLLEIKELISNLEEKSEVIEATSSEFLINIYEEKLKTINKYYGTKNMYWLLNKLVEFSTLSKTDNKEFKKS